MQDIKTSMEFIKSQTSITPSIGLILGSGLGDIAEDITDAVKINYSDIPGFCASNVEGHAGKLVIGKLSGKNVVAMQGRFHYYEGHSIERVVFPIKVMKKIGVEKLILTNAAGGVNTDFSAGDLMIIKDHIAGNMPNPLIGRNDNDLGPRFPDMSTVYNKELIQVAKDQAKKLGLTLKEGVYFANTGPCYETPSEIRMVRSLGGDAVGMSTVPEAIVANYMKMSVFGISCITNMAAGVLPQPLDHQEVIDTAARVKNDFINLIKNIVKEA